MAYAFPVEKFVWEYRIVKLGPVYSFIVTFTASLAIPRHLAWYSPCFEPALSLN